MKVEYINPFVESVSDLFTTMLESEAHRGTLALAAGPTKASEITAIIGFSGPMRGTVAMSFPDGTAISMVEKMLGMEISALDDTVTDGVAEMVNIVTGGAKTHFAGDGPPLTLSLPTVVRGSDYRVLSPSPATWIEIPFSSTLGDFSLRVTVESNGKRQ